MVYTENLETKDLILRKARQSDLNCIFNKYWSSEITAKYMLWNAQKNLQEAQERLDKTIKYQKDHLAFFVCEKATGEAIGQAGMKEIEPGIYEDSGLGIGQKFTGQGYGKQILTCLIDYLFNNLGANKIICSCHKDNIASSSLQKSCGLKFDHSEIYTREKDGLTYRADYYVITKKDWLRHK